MAAQWLVLHLPAQESRLPAVSNLLDDTRMTVDAREKLAEQSVSNRIVRRLIVRVGSPDVSVRLWSGEEITTSSSPVARLIIREPRAVLALLRSPSVGFGECYSRGLVDVEGNILDFTNAITSALTRKRLEGYYGPKLRSMLRAAHSNSLIRARQNVRHHYDLGNDFYRMWLDEKMVYTCAYYANPDATLAEAQIEKMDHVARKLRLRPGQTVVEAGCGWGALAMHMAEHYDVNVVAYNNSSEQVELARQRVSDAGLAGRVVIVKDDYRNIDRRCDAFVSIGMLEHVGLANFRTLGSVIRRNLKPGGTGLIHTIGRSYSSPSDPWIAKYIFPGGHVPSLGEISSVFEPHRFSILDVENLRLHYSRTCAAWLENFERVADKVADMYDEEFVRMWRLYLAGSSAGFQSGTLQLYQILFAPYGNNDVPWTRGYQYGVKAGRQ